MLQADLTVAGPAGENICANQLFPTSIHRTLSLLVHLCIVAWITFLRNGEKVSGCQLCRGSLPSFSMCVRQPASPETCACQKPRWGPLGHSGECPLRRADRQSPMHPYCQLWYKSVLCTFCAPSNIYCHKRRSRTVESLVADTLAGSSGSPATASLPKADGSQALP